MGDCLAKIVCFGVGGCSAGEYAVGVPEVLCASGVLDCYMTGAMLEGVKRQVQEQAPEEPAALRHQEEALLKLLRRQVEMAVA
jgi:hypothetical protein